MSDTETTEAPAPAAQASAPSPTSTSSTGRATSSAPIIGCRRSPTGTARRRARSMAIRPCCGSSPATSAGPTGRRTWRSSSTLRIDVPQPDVRPVQGAPPAAARGPGPAIPADPRRHQGLFDPVHRRGRAGGRRHHRLLRHRRDQGRLAGDHRQLRQGPDAADRRGRGRRHARHDERPADRAKRGAGEVRGAAGEGRRRAGADGRQRRQRPRAYPGSGPRPHRS